MFKRYGKLVNPFGRIRHKYKIFSDEFRESTSDRQASNFPIQSTAGDIQVRELIKMDPELKANGVMPVLTVHDSVVMYCPKEKLKWLWEYFNKETCVRIPEMNNMLMLTEMDIGRNYGEHVKLPYTCNFERWAEEHKDLFE
jgi:DNA polymerase I-like protein with 3'-5' exonuclease and polymerase domains